MKMQKTAFFRKYVCVLAVIGSFLLVSGCAATPENPWNDIDITEVPAASPVDCGSFPMPSEVVGDSIVYTNAGVNDLESYRACSEANARIVTEHALQIAQLKRARAALVSAGKSQRNIAEMRQEMLEDERKHNFFMKIGLYVVILGMGVSL